MNSFFKILLFVVVIFFIFEGMGRIFFPEFSNRSVEVFENYSVINKKNNYYKNYSNEIEIKVRDNKIEESKNIDNQIYLIGDSVTAGFGLSYQNTYYSITEKYLNNIGYKIKLKSLGGNGSNLNSQLKNLGLIENFDRKKVNTLIYQFSYNDLSPAYIYGHNKGNEYFGSKERSNFFKKIAIMTAKFRYRYLNKSNFLSMIQFYLGKFRYKTWIDDCKKRGVYSLGEYSYAFYSKGLENDSEKVWRYFFEDLKKLKKFSIEKKLDLFVLISPISLQIPDQEFANPYNYDIKCSTKDPRLILTNFLEKNEIKLIDPTDNFKKFIDNTKNENNSEKLFFDFDHSHPNEIGSRIIAEELFKNLYIHLNSRNDFN